MMEYVQERQSLRSPLFEQAECLEKLKEEEKEGDKFIKSGMI